MAVSAWTSSAEAARDVSANASIFVVTAFIA
jgi:hypothetical protein